MKPLRLAATAGQAYPTTIGALFLLAARFDRQFWKYQGHPKALSALLLEAGRRRRSVAVALQSRDGRNR